MVFSQAKKSNASLLLAIHLNCANSLLVLALATDDVALRECLHCSAFVGAVEESSCALDGATDSIFVKASRRTDHACFQDPYRLPRAAIECCIEVHLNISTHARLKLKL